MKKAEHRRTDAFEKTLESPLDCKEIQPVYPKVDQLWVFIDRTDVEAETPILWPPHAKELTHWKRLWCWEGLGAGREGNNIGWEGWMASLTRWTWVWVNFGSLWWTGRPAVLWFVGLQRVGHDWVTELNWRGKGKIRSNDTAEPMGEGWGWGCIFKEQCLRPQKDR